MLQFAHVALYLVFALNVSGDPGVNLLATIILICGILLLKGHFGRIYKTNAVDKIEMICYLNIGILSAIQLFLFKAGIEQTVDASAYVSGTITLLLLFIVIAYHVFTEFCSKSLKKYKQRGRRCDKREDTNNDIIDHPPENIDLHEPTFSVVEGPPHRDRPDHRSSPTHSINEANDDDVSIISTDSTAPLLDKSDY